MKKTTAPLTFETALQELQALVAQLEVGNVSLSESLALFERGQSLVQACSALLEQAELRIVQVQSDKNEPARQQQLFIPD
ncbi:MAG TPA: exodeoxyribonuclease VII small subunit [Anaerolineales bacterium]|nr:exodeoxyribonuclease VII small subunit [Anaerolineales bacterium]